MEMKEIKIERQRNTRQDTRRQEEERSKEKVIYERFLWDTAREDSGQSWGNLLISDNIAY